MKNQQRPPDTELSRPIEVARIPKLGSHEKLSASSDECKALAKRLMVPAVHAVSASLVVKPWRGGGFKLAGEATIDLEQESVISLEQFRRQQIVGIERYFLASLPGDEDTGERDIDPIVNGMIDIGEVVAETIALELDPYPRKPGERFEAVPEDETQPERQKPNPFASLLQTPRKG